MPKIKLINKLLKDCFTGRDNCTYDVGRILWALSVIAYIVFSGMDVYLTTTFEYEQFGVGLATILGAGGLSLYFKKETEPRKSAKSR